MGKIQKLVRLLNTNKMYKFNRIKIGKIVSPSFSISKGEVVQLVFSSLTDTHLTDDYDQLIKHLIKENPNYVLVNINILFDSISFFKANTIENFLLRHEIESDSRILIYLKKESLPLSTKISALGYNLRYILALEFFLLNNNFLILSLAGLDYSGISQVLEILKTSVLNGKSFIVLKDYNELSKSFSLGKEYPVNM